MKRDIDWAYKESVTSVTTDPKKMNTAKTVDPNVSNDQMANGCPSRLPCGICMILGKDCPKEARPYEFTC